MMCEYELLKVGIGEDRDENVELMQEDRVKRIVKSKERLRTRTFRRTIQSAKNDWKFFAEYGYAPI